MNLKFIGQDDVRANFEFIGQDDVRANFDSLHVPMICTSLKLIGVTYEYIVK